YLHVHQAFAACLFSNRPNARSAEHLISVAHCFFQSAWLRPTHETNRIQSPSRFIKTSISNHFFQLLQLIANAMTLRTSSHRPLFPLSLGLIFKLGSTATRQYGETLLSGTHSHTIEL